MFITRLNCNNIKSVFVVDGLSDHHTVIIDLWFKLVSEPSQQCVTFRPINTINVENFREDIEHADLLIITNSTLCEVVKQWYVTLSSLLDKHAPKQTKGTNVRPQTPWMSLEILV